MHDYPPRRSCWGQSKRGLCAAIFCAVFAWAPACLAQKEVAPFAPSHQIAAHIHWIQFHMISGRIVASSPMVVPRTTVPPSTSHVGGRKEHLSIEISAAVASLQYDLVTADEHLQITVEDGNQMSLRHSRSKEPQFEFEFQQRPDEPLTITLDKEDVKQSWQADGFWQLSIAEPEVVRQHLVPFLEWLHPSWQLTATAAEIEDALVERTPTSEQPDRQRWARWVEELANPRFTARQNAQRELHRAGQVIVPFLQNLDRSRLDAEQAYRVRWLIESLSVDYEDKVDRVATWLAGDTQVWLSLAGRDDPAKRRLAALQLRSLLGGPIAFDPDAPPAVRQAQLEKLHEQYALRVPATPVNAEK